LMLNAAVEFSMLFPLQSCIVGHSPLSGSQNRTSLFYFGSKAYMQLRRPTPTLSLSGFQAC
jgi:hypothetical protein